MFYLLPDDIIYSILLMIDNINYIINISNINTITYKLIDNNFYNVWGRYIYTNEFWNKAEKRSTILSKPLLNMKMELLRIDNFNNYQKKHGYELWEKEDYYAYWKSLELAYGKNIKS